MKLYHQSIGSGRPLLILHGLFGSSDNWRSVAKILASSCRVITVDLRNHGRSPHSSEQTYSLMVDDLRALLDELQLEKVDLIGHSVGGKVAMAFSEQYPDSVNKLIVVDIAPRQYLPEHNAIFKALLALDLEQYYKRSALDQALAVTLPNKAVRQFLLMNISSKNESLQWQINLPALWTNYSYLLAEVCRSTNIAIPSCFVVGGKSNYITNDDHALIHSLFSNVSIITVEQAGHWVHAEAPAEFIRLVNEFFNYD